MKAVVEPLEGNKVKLSIELDEQEFEKDIDAAFRKIAREVRIPGFRPGKAPRRILEARLGKEAGRTEALRDALPSYYSQAVREHEVDVVAPPEIDIKGGEDSGAVSFDAVVEVRPQIQLPGYNGLRVEIPSPLATEEDIDAQIDRLRGNFGELVDVDRAARSGDFLSIDMSGTRDGEAVAGLSMDDFSYELGSGSVLPELDTHLEGAKLGDILSFDAEIPGQEPATLKVLVKGIKEKKLPELTDEWAAEASEFDTVEALRGDIAKRLAMVKRVQANMALRNATIEALVELVTDDPPQSLIDAEVERQVHEMGHQLERQGATINDYLEATGQSGPELVEALRAQSVPAVKADLALRAVAEAEGIDPTEEDIDAEMERLAQAYNMKAKQVRLNLERADQMLAVRSDWRKTRALEWLLGNVEIVDPEGQAIDRGLLELDQQDPAPEDGATIEEAPESSAAAVAAGGDDVLEEDVPQDEETGEQ